jgi:hypothetical protein
VQTPEPKKRRSRFDIPGGATPWAAILLLLALALPAAWHREPVPAALPAPAPVPAPAPAPPQPEPAPEPTAAPVPPAGAEDGCPRGCTVQKPGCDIKGNISLKSGEKIYHRPGQSYYGKTVISPENGERWFCTEEEARENGWRKSKV